MYYRLDPIVADRCITNWNPIEAGRCIRVPIVAGKYYRLGPKVARRSIRVLIVERRSIIVPIVKRRSIRVPIVGRRSI